MSVTATRVSGDRLQHPRQPPPMRSAVTWSIQVSGVLQADVQAAGLASQAVVSRYSPQVELGRPQL